MEPIYLAVALLLAFLFDLLFGEPPSSFHPVVYIGKVIKFCDDKLNQGSNASRLLIGAFMSALIPIFFVLLYRLVQVGLEPIPIVMFIADVYILKSTFALQALRSAGVRVGDAIKANDVEGSRKRLGWLCSRDPSSLDEKDIVSATLGSLGENLSDSVVAPLFYFALFGIEGAIFYRVVNTMDAMIGYRSETYEYFGKFSARLDDTLNYIPARISAFILLIAALVMKFDWKNGLQILKRDRRKTESPNAGWPMATMAGLLRVEIYKRNHYCLGSPLDELSSNRILEASRVLLITGFLSIFFSLGLIYAKIII